MTAATRADAVVIGAGPYGLSVAAHLRDRGCSVKVFGRVMDTWRNRMPPGLFLKSEGFASNLSDPKGTLTLGRYCRDHDLEYADIGVPVARDTFIGYGSWFAERAVADIDEGEVQAVHARNGAGFAVELADQSVDARALVVATGVPLFAQMPPVLNDLPPSLVSHSADHASLAGFAGKTVAVIGGGQSALETAALLHEAGAKPTVIVRKPALIWNGNPPDETRSLVHRLRWPLSPLGTGLHLWAYSYLAPGYRFLPVERRVRIAWETLGPAGAWWLRQRIEGQVPVLLGHRLVGASADGDRLRLQLEAAGETRELEADHVIAATGYRVELAQLGYLPAELRSRIRLVAGSPSLSRSFESSVPGLYFVGMAAAETFGPVMRFVCGTEVAARRVAAAI